MTDKKTIYKYSAPIRFAIVILFVVSWVPLIFSFKEGGFLYVFSYVMLTSIMMFTFYASMTHISFIDNDIHILISDRLNQIYWTGSLFKFDEVMLSIGNTLSLKKKRTGKVIWSNQLTGYSPDKLREILSEFEKRGKNIWIDASLDNVFNYKMAQRRKK